MSRNRCRCSVAFFPADSASWLMELNGLKTGSELLLCFQVHMKQVMSSVWLQGLDVSYLRQQVHLLSLLLHTRKT